MISVPRRSLLKGAAGLVVAFSIPMTAEASPTTLVPDSVDAYLAIAPDGKVTVYAGKVDLGTGARAALRQIVAEELGIVPMRVTLVEGDTALTPNQGGTGGSTGIMVGGMQIRQAAATARAILLRMASEKFGVPVTELYTAAGAQSKLADSLEQAGKVDKQWLDLKHIAENGPLLTPKDVRVLHDTRAVDYGELIGGRTFQAAVDKDAVLAKPDDYVWVGQSYPRPDIPEKLTGRHTYVHDFRLDGMLHARIVRPPAIGSKLLGIDAGSIASIPGARIVRKSDFLAVVAPREWDAVRALRAIKATWTEAATLPGSDAVFDAVRNTPVARAETLRATGDAATVLSGAGHVLSATYHWPIQSHGSMGPSCAIADIRDGGGTVWTSSQNTHRSRVTFAKLLGLATEKLRLIYMDGAGSYGSNGNDDAAFEAALISREVGKPVRVQWMREDEHGFDPKGPPQLLDLRGALDTDGNIAAWETVAMVPANTPGTAGTPLLAAIAAGLDDGTGMSSGLTSLNADPPYAVPDMRATIRWLSSTPLRPSNLRAPGKIGNVFAVESFVDELAHAAGVDPLAFRLRQLKDSRGAEVLRRVAEMMAWTPRTAPPDRSGDVLRGRGIAYVHYKQAENYVAMGVEVEVTPASGAVRVTRVACAHDCGMMINPDAVHAQVEGCILQTISRTLFEEVTFDRSRVTSTDWSSYPILTFPDVPRLDIALLDRRHERPLGAGEAATAPVAAAIGNAVFDATGVRLREAPFTPARVKAALAARAA
jgi:CO/xanthine dehydrogenase Mo-binding subunit